MESLSNLLSPFDDLELFICEEHGMPCIGLCSNYMCKQRAKFLCMKCIKSGETCITKEKHELITLTEENKSFDLMEIQTMNQIIKDYNKSELNKISEQFRSLKNSNVMKFDN